MLKVFWMLLSCAVWCSADPGKSLAIVCVQSDHVIVHKGNGGVKEHYKQQTMGALIDKNKRLFLTDNTFFECQSDATVTMFFADGSSSPAHVIYQDIYADFALVEADHVPADMPALPVKATQHTGDIQIYGFLAKLGKMSYFVTPSRIEGKTQDGCGHARLITDVNGGLLLNDNHEIVGIQVWGNTYASCEKISYALERLQANKNYQQKETTYTAALIETSNLRWYTNTLDAQLSFSSDEPYALHIYCVVKGDGVFKEGDIVKYRHIDHMNGKEVWYAAEGIFYHSQDVKVLRDGEVISLPSSVKPSGFPERIEERGMIFFRITPFLRTLWDLHDPQRWLAYVAHYEQLPLAYSSPPKMLNPLLYLDSIDGKKEWDDVTLRDCLRLGKPIMLKPVQGRKRFVMFETRASSTIFAMPIGGGLCC
ncbi:MAG: hypothetical protein OXC30_05730 [Alphaproteobacteria bacterium]|nr:hypothetical protein [Alphaproteobacteria bacterium]